MSSTIFTNAHKTVFLLDHTHWMRESSGVQIEIDNGAGNNGGQSGGSRGSSRGGGLNYFTSFIPPVTKSLWTCAVENVLEYTRVVLDLFADERLIRFALCQGQQGHLTWLNNWDLLADGSQQQSLSYISEKFANAGTPMLANKSTPSSVAAMQLGIKSAIEALSQPTPGQIAFMNGPGSFNNKSSLKAINKGRVICITSCTSDSVGKSSAEDLEDFFLNALTQHNRIVAPASDHLLPILDCEFVLISVHPVGKEHLSRVLSRPLHEISPILKGEVHVAPANRIYEKIIDLCVTHHDLISTTVTGIPMKEEQNALSSSNYDVPLWHPRMPTSNLDSSILRWSSPSAPKTIGLVGAVPHCISACRITPVDVNSRPSTCLSAFVVNGRSVWLEMPKKGKTTSHMLTPHGGEMWMHIIETARNVLEDPPSISEGIGGRVTDYRIPDFAEFIRMNLLIPYPRNYHEHIFRSKPDKDRDRDGNPFVRRRSNSLEDVKKPIEMASARLNRKSAYWPMTISGSLLFAIAVHIDNLLRLMVNDTLSEMDKVECDKCIWSLMAVENRGEAAVPSSHKKGQKKDEQWRAVYAELEAFIRANQHSENHKKVLECFLESRRTDSRSEEKNTRLKDPNIEKALAEMASLGSNNEITDSPMSPPPPANSTKPEIATAVVNKKSLLSLWTLKNEKKDLRVLTNTKLYSSVASAGDKTDSK